MIQWKLVEHREVGQLFDGPYEKRKICAERNCKRMQVLLADIAKDRHAKSVVVVDEKLRNVKTTHHDIINTDLIFRTFMMCEKQIKRCFHSNYTNLQIF